MQFTLNSALSSQKEKLPTARPPAGCAEGVSPHVPPTAAARVRRVSPRGASARIVQERGCLPGRGEGEGVSWGGMLLMSRNNSARSFGVLITLRKTFALPGGGGIAITQEGGNLQVSSTNKPLSSRFSGGSKRFLKISVLLANVVSLQTPCRGREGSQVIRSTEFKGLISTLVFLLYPSTQGHLSIILSMRITSFKLNCSSDAALLQSYELVTLHMKPLGKGMPRINLVFVSFLC